MAKSKKNLINNDEVAISTSSFVEDSLVEQKQQKEEAEVAIPVKEVIVKAENKEIKEAKNDRTLMGTNHDFSMSTTILL